MGDTLNINFGPTARISEMTNDPELRKLLSKFDTNQDDQLELSEIPTDLVAGIHLDPRRVGPGDLRWTSAQIEAVETILRKYGFLSKLVEDTPNPAVNRPPVWWYSPDYKMAIGPWSETTSEGTICGIALYFSHQLTQIAINSPQKGKEKKKP
jgi:hypothetical protein